MRFEQFPPPGYIAAPSAVEGIEVYMPAPPAAKIRPEVFEFKCPRCGATTSFSASEGRLVCSNCGYEENVTRESSSEGAGESEFTPAALDSARLQVENRLDLVCQACGALTSVPSTQISHTCPFCGSNNVYQQATAQDSLRPRFLVPLSVSQPRSSEIARTWIGSSWMTPGSLKAKSLSANFNALYLPFWIFDAVTQADWKAEVGHDRTEKYYQDGEWRTRTVTDWRWESGSANLQINDLTVPGTGKLSHKLIQSILDFDLKDLVEFEPKFLAGFIAHLVDIPLEKGWENGRQQMRELTKSACLGQASTSKVRNFSMSLDFSSESWRYVLLPVYLSTYRYAGKSYTLIINGQTGTIGGQRPVDWNKVWLVIGALLAPGALLGILGLLTLAVAGIGLAIGAVGFVLFIFGLVASLVIFFQAHKLDDI